MLLIQRSNAAYERSNQGEGIHLLLFVKHKTQKYEPKTMHCQENCLLLTDDLRRITKAMNNRFDCLG
jgi:hypothetical protein